MLLPLCLVAAIALPQASASPGDASNTDATSVPAVAQPFVFPSFQMPKIDWNAERFWSPYSVMPTMPHNYQEFNQATGNWLGLRDTLEKEGVEFSFTYTSDIAGNPVGGLGQGFTYTDNFALGLLLRTEPLFGWHGGTFIMSVLQRDGDSLSQKFIGNQFTVQQVYGGQTFHWYELSYQQDFANDHASLKMGRFSAGDDFASSPLYWLYMNNGIDGNPQSLPVNGQFSTYPNAVWAARLKADLTSETVAKIGIYQVAPNSVHGLNWNMDPSNGVMLVAQYGWNPEFFKPTGTPAATPAPTDDKNVATASKPTALPDKSYKSFATSIDSTTLHGLPGHYWMGGYYSTWQYAQFNNGSAASNAFGLYWHADQMIYRADPKSDTGLVAWSAFTLCPQQGISKIPFQYNGGLVYTGLLPIRPDDFTIFGVSYGTFSSTYATSLQQSGGGYANFELVYELGYRINLTKFAYVQPDAQWIINPGGTGTIPNALVLGAQIGVTF